MRCSPPSRFHARAQQQVFLVAETAVRTQREFPNRSRAVRRGGALRAAFVQAEVPRHGHYPRHGLALAAVGLRGLVYVHVAVVQDVLGVLPIFRYGEGIGEHRAAGACGTARRKRPCRTWRRALCTGQAHPRAHARRLRFHFVCGGRHRVPPFVLLYTYNTRAGRFIAIGIIFLCLGFGEGGRIRARNFLFPHWQ